MRAIDAPSLVLAAGLLAAAPLAPAWAEPVTAERQAMLEKPWVTSWTGDGFLYNGALSIAVDDDGAVEGDITWTLRRAPPEEDQSRVGQSAVESVRGLYSPTLGAMTFTGYAVTDEMLIGMDVYRLAVAEDGSSMLGLTESGGSWDGRIEFVPE